MARKKKADAPSTSPPPEKISAKESVTTVNEKSAVTPPPTTDLTPPPTAPVRIPTLDPTTGSPPLSHPSSSTLITNTQPQQTSPSASTSTQPTDILTYDKTISKTHDDSNVVISTANPPKENAVILNHHQGLEMIDYLLGISEITPSEEIIYAARISQNRICVHFKSKKWVDALANHGYISTKIGRVSVRRMINPAFRLVLSNVMPFIPDHVLIEAVSDFAKIVSPVQCVSAGVRDPRFAHIKSHRRQIFIEKSQDSHDIPNSILVTHGGEQTRVFLNFEDNKCFKCLADGHKTFECASRSEPMKDQAPSISKRLSRVHLSKSQDKSALSVNPTNSYSQIVKNQPPVDCPNSTSLPLNKSTEQLQEVGNAALEETLQNLDGDHQMELNLPNNNQGPKTPLQPFSPETQSTNPTQKTPSNETESPLNPKTVRKRNQVSPVNDQLRGTKEAKKENSTKKKKLSQENRALNEAIKNTLEFFDQIDLSETEIVNLMTELKSSKKPLEVVETFTSDFETFREFLRELGSSTCLTKNLKQRIDRLVKTLTELPSEASSDSDSSTSLLSQSQ